MYAEITISDPIPSNVGVSYHPLEFAKYGVFAWEYDNGMRGPVHWVNWKKCRVEPEYKNPKAYWYWFQPNVQFSIIILPTINTEVADAYINGVAVNILTGKGLPLIP